MSAFNKDMFDAWCRYRMGRVATQSQSDAFTAGYRDGLAKGIYAAAKVAENLIVERTILVFDVPTQKSIPHTYKDFPTQEEIVVAIERLKEE
jgi:hypothetical protein